MLKQPEGTKEEGIGHLGEGGSISYTSCQSDSIEATAPVFCFHVTKERVKEPSQYCADRYRVNWTVFARSTWHFGKRIRYWSDKRQGVGSVNFASYVWSITVIHEGWPLERRGMGSHSAWRINMPSHSGMLAECSMGQDSSRRHFTAACSKPQRPRPNRHAHIDTTPRPTRKLRQPSDCLLSSGPALAHARLPQQTWNYAIIINLESKTACDNSRPHNL